MDGAVAAAIGVELRAFVTAAGTRRALPTTCHVGILGAERVELRDGDAHDIALRTDLVERALDGLDSVLGSGGWLTRGGDLTRCDADAGWFAAARTGFDRHGLRLPWFFVVNRTGWVDLVSGETRTWSRVRARPTAGPQGSQRPGVHRLVGVHE